MIKFVHKGHTVLEHSVLRPARNRDDLRSFMRRPHLKKFRVEFVKNLLSVICDDNAIASATLARGRASATRPSTPTFALTPQRVTATSASTVRPAESAARTRNGPCCVRKSAGSAVTCERCEQFPDAMVAVERVPKRHGGVELVAVAPPLSHPLEISSLFEFGHDALRRSLRNSDLRGDITHPHVRVL